MIQRIYHGSKDIIEKPKFGYGKPYNDYGLGFYCTDSIEMAKEWGVSIDRDGYANIYDIDMSSLAILDLNDENYGILHWLAVLLKNREFDAVSPLAAEAKEYISNTFKIDYSSADKMNELYAKKNTTTNLKKLRLAAGMSQSELSETAEVPLRTIQQYEQRQKNINKAQTETVLKLADALFCRPIDLMEKVVV